MKELKPETSGVININELYTLPEVKRRLKVNDAGLRVMRRLGLQSIRIGKRVYYAGDEIIQFLKENRNHGSNR